MPLHLDLTGAERLWGPTCDAARRFQKEVQEQMGLTGTLGVAGNKLVSNVASRALSTIRIEQGVTLALCLVSWIDFLLHLENHKRSTAEKLPKEPLTVPSIVRLAQYDNLEAFVERLQKDDGLLKKWFEVEQKHLVRKRKKNNTLIKLEDSSEVCCKEPLAKAA
ncbi:conserved domain protein [delta proteobacterium NaphS2]|nr:conserved domain protein [delta proteobacterium NaphS2]